MDFVQWITSVDYQLLQAIGVLHCDFMNAVMAFFSYIGEVGIIWIVATIVMLCFKKTRCAGVMAGIALILGLLIGEFGLKAIVCRPRPYTTYPDIFQNIAQPRGFSFPSGHACSSFAFAVAVFSRHKAIGSASLAIAVLIAFSRLYNCVHYPTDVLAGALIGVVCAFVTILIFRKTKLEKRLSR